MSVRAWIVTRSLLILAGFGLNAPLSAQEKKLPVPSAADQKNSETEVRALFKAEFTQQGRNDKRAFAQKLLEQAKDGSNTAASRYVLIFLARDVATEAMDLTTAFGAVDQLDLTYELGRPPLTGATFTIVSNAHKSAVLTAAKRNAISAEDQAAIAEAYMQLSEAALELKQFDDASTAAQQAARNTKDPDVASRAAELLKEVPLLKQEEEAGRKAELTLAAKPDDIEAIATLWRYLLFSRKDEEAGFRYLSKSSDAGLQELARREMAKPSDCDGLSDLAERWLSLAEKESKPFNKKRCLERAVQTFYRSLDAATGLTKVKTEKRIDDVWNRLGVQPPRGGLVGFWSFDEGAGTKATDSSSKASHGTLTKGVEWIQGKIGKAVKCDGNGGQVTLPVQVNTSISNSFTISFWALPDASAPAGRRFVIYPTPGGIASPGDTHAGVGVAVAAKTVEVYEHAGSYFPTAVRADTDLSVWTHVAVVYKNRVPSLFINGRFVAKGAQSAKDVHPGYPIGGGTNGFIVGYYAGLLDEVRYYDCALSERSVAALARRVYSR